MLFHGSPPRRSFCVQATSSAVAGAAIRTHIFDFIVRPFQETRFREALKRIKEGDVAVRMAEDTCENFG